MKPGLELTESYQALDDDGNVHTVHVYAEVISIEKPDGSTEQTFGAKTLTTGDNHPVAQHDDGTLEDLQDRIRMRRIESP